MSDLEIVWTKVDEAPGLATFSLLPIVEAFVGTAGVKMKLKAMPLRMLGKITLRMEISRLMWASQNVEMVNRLKPMATSTRFRTFPTSRPTMKFITNAPMPRGLSVSPLCKAE